MTTTRPKGRRLRVGALIASVVMLLATAVAIAPPADAQGLRLVFTLNGDRVDAQDLNGAVIPADANLAVWVAPRYHPARRVEFFLNGEYVRTENRAPWDLSGTGAWDRVNSMPSNDLPEGRNTVVAEVRGYFGRDRTLTATFERAPAPPDNAFGLDFSDAEQLLDSYVFDENLNGAGLVVVHPDHGIVHEAYRGEINPDRVSLLASTSKAISAGVLLHLADDGLFDMDQPLSEIVDWGAGLPGVTPAHLVSNSSGLNGLPLGYVFNPCILDKSITVLECGRRVAENRNDDWAQSAPGAEYRYGGPQWQVAGALAEAVTGQSWAELLNEIYVEPCGLNVLGYTNFAVPRLFWEGLPYPGTFDGDVNQLRPTDNPIIEGGGYTTPHDYAEFLLMLLRDGRCPGGSVLSPAAIDQMLSDQPSAGSYGMGWIVDGPVSQDPGFFGAIAWIDREDGYAAYFVIESIALGPLTPDRDPLLAAVDQAMAGFG